MQDFNGNELQIGDQVYVLNTNRTQAEMCLGEVIGFTKCKVRVKLLSSSYIAFNDTVLKETQRIAKVFINKD